MTCFGAALSGVVLVAGCGRLGFDPVDAGAGDATIADAAVGGPFGTPMQVSALSYALTDDDPSATSDRLELYFASERLGAAGGYADIFVSRRASTSEAWPAPVPVVELNTMYEDQAPGVAGDGLSIYFSSRRPAGGNSDIWMATRATRSDPWSTPVMIAELSSTYDEFEPQPDASGLRMVLYRTLPTGNDLFEASRASTTTAWQPPVAVAELNTGASERSPCLAAAGRELWFASDRDGAANVPDLYVARRTTTSDPFTAPESVPELNSTDSDDDPWLSPDGHTLLFTSNRSGNYEIYEATR